MQTSWQCDRFLGANTDNALCQHELCRLLGSVTGFSANTDNAMMRRASMSLGTLLQALKQVNLVTAQRPAVLTQ